MATKKVMCKDGYAVTGGISEPCMQIGMPGTVVSEGAIQFSWPGKKHSHMVRLNTALELTWNGGMCVLGRGIYAVSILKEEIQLEGEGVWKQCIRFTGVWSGLHSISKHHGRNGQGYLGLV